MTVSRTPAQDHTCRECRHWVRTGEYTALCFRYPPTALMRHDGEVRNGRPEADANDRACGEFDVALEFNVVLLPSPPTRWQRFVALFRGAR